LDAPGAEITPHFWPWLQRYGSPGSKQEGVELMNCEGARNTARRLALVGMARDLASADVRAVRTGIGAELRKLYSHVLREEMPAKMAELLKQLDR
jgi:hypothetical protein